MTNPIRGRLALGVVAVLLASGVAFAGAMTEVLSEVRKPTTLTSPTFLAALSDLDGTDSTTWSATTALATARVHPMSGDPLLEVVVRHSAAGATACVEVGRRARDGTFQGIAGIQTSTAGSGNTVAYDGTGYYAAEPLYFALNGHYAAEVRVTDASGSTTVSLKMNSVGLAARAAE